MTASRNKPTNLPGMVQSQGRQPSAAFWDHKLAPLGSPSSLQSPRHSGQAGALSSVPSPLVRPGRSKPVGLFPKCPARHTGRAQEQAWIHGHALHAMPTSSAPHAALRCRGGRSHFFFYLFIYLFLVALGVNLGCLFDVSLIFFRSVAQSLSRVRLFATP